MDIIEQAIQVSDEKASILRSGILHFGEKYIIRYLFIHEEIRDFFGAREGSYKYLVISLTLSNFWVYKNII